MESKRQLQVAENIKRNFGIVLQSEGPYIYQDAFVTVTRVIMTPDLLQAKIYLSVYNTENKDEVIYMINQSLHGLKQSLAYRIKNHVRRIPEILVFRDETLDEMYKLNSIFDDIKKDDSEE